MSNAVKDIFSRIRQNLDFFELDPNSGEFGYVDHPVFSSVQILHGVPVGAFGVVTIGTQGCATNVARSTLHPGLI